MRDIKLKAFNEDRGVFVRAKLVENESSNWIDERGFPVVQYTGLKDKNGVEIYEGDIVSSPVGSGIVGEVYYWITLAKFVVGYERGCDDMHLEFNSFDMTFEVIGNIHENPELLEQAQ